MKTLANTRVGDLMQRNIVTVRPEDTVHSLTRLLSDHQISGAPVVDSTGKVVGVVSATDVLRLTADETDARVGTFPTRPPAEDVPESGDDELDLVSYFAGMETTVFAPEGVDWIAEDVFSERTVGEIMTPVSFSVRSDATVEELAELLVRGRIHRALVVDDGELGGIVTTFDVLRGLTRD